MTTAILTCQWCGAQVLSDWEDNRCFMCSREHSDTGELIPPLPAPRVAHGNGTHSYKRKLRKGGIR